MDQLKADSVIGLKGTADVSIIGLLLRAVAERCPDFQYSSTD